MILDLPNNFKSKPYKFNINTYFLIALNTWNLKTTIFCYHLKKTAAESHRMLVEAHGEHTLGKSQWFGWFKKFKSGDFDLRKEERGSLSKKFELQALLDEDDAQTLKLGETINTETLPTTNDGFKPSIMCEKRPEYQKRQHEVILLHDNVPSHTGKPLKKTIEAFSLQIFSHAAYSPDLAASDY